MFNGTTKKCHGGGRDPTSSLVRSTEIVSILNKRMCCRTKTSSDKFVSLVTKFSVLFKASERYPCSPESRRRAELGVSVGIAFPGLGQ